MKLTVAFDNLSKFFTDEDMLAAPIPAEVFRNEDGEVEEIRIYNVEYEQFITIDRNGNIEAISVEEYEKTKI